MARATRFILFGLLMPLFLIFASGQVLAQGNSITVTFEWQQPDSPADLAGWKLWVATAAGGPYDKGQVYFRDNNGNPIDFVDIPYSGTPSSSYTADAYIVVPENASTTLFFVVNAWDTDGNFSANSNEVSETFDFVAPGTPINFKVKIKIRGGG